MTNGMKPAPDYKSPFPVKPLIKGFIASVLIFGLWLFKEYLKNESTDILMNVAIVCSIVYPVFIILLTNRIEVCGNELQSRNWVLPVHWRTIQLNQVAAMGLNRDYGKFWTAICYRKKARGKRKRRLRGIAVQNSHKELESFFELMKAKGIYIEHRGWDK